MRDRHSEESKNHVVRHKKQNKLNQDGSVISQSQSVTQVGQLLRGSLNVDAINK